MEFAALVLCDYVDLAEGVLAFPLPLSSYLSMLIRSR